jgi:hypothetical protein
MSVSTLDLVPREQTARGTGSNAESTWTPPAAYTAVGQALARAANRTTSAGYPTSGPPPDAPARSACPAPSTRSRWEPEGCWTPGTPTSCPTRRSTRRAAPASPPSARPALAPTSATRSRSCARSWSAAKASPPRLPGTRPRSRRSPPWLRACERGPDVRGFGARAEWFSLINVADLGAHFCGGRDAAGRRARIRRAGQRPGG